MEFTLKIKEIFIIPTMGTDKINIELEDAPSAFPEMKYPVTMVIEARKGYGTDWCEKMFGITPRIINTEFSYLKLNK
jgi:hypothetical protein